MASESPSYARCSKYVTARSSSLATPCSWSKQMANSVLYLSLPFATRDSSSSKVRSFFENIVLCLQWKQKQRKKVCFIISRQRNTLWFWSDMYVGTIFGLHFGFSHFMMFRWHHKGEIFGIIPPLALFCGFLPHYPKDNDHNRLCFCFCFCFEFSKVNPVKKRCSGKK